MGSTSFRCRLRFCYPYLATTLLEESSYSRSKDRGNNLAQPSPRSVRVMQSYSRFRHRPVRGTKGCYRVNQRHGGSARFSRLALQPSGSFSTTLRDDGDSRRRLQQSLDLPLGYCAPPPSSSRRKATEIRLVGSSLRAHDIVGKVGH